MISRNFMMIGAAGVLMLNTAAHAEYGQQEQPGQQQGQQQAVKGLEMFGMLRSVDADQQIFVIDRDRNLEQRMQESGRTPSGQTQPYRVGMQQGSVQQHGTQQDNAQQTSAQQTSAQQDMTQRDKDQQYKARQDKDQQYKARQDRAQLGIAPQNSAQQNSDQQDRAHQGMAQPGMAQQDGSQRDLAHEDWARGAQREQLDGRQAEQDKNRVFHYTGETVVSGAINSIQGLTGKAGTPVRIEYRTEGTRAIAEKIEVLDRKGVEADAKDSMDSSTGDND